MRFAPVDRARAVSLTRLSQVAGVVLLGAGGLAAAMLGPNAGQSPPEVLEVPVLPPLVTPGPGAARSDGPVDAAVLAGRFAAIGNAPRVPEPPPTPTNEVPVVTAEEPPAATIEILYLGPAALGGARFALVSIDGAQRIVGIRDGLGEGEVKAITPQQLTINENGSDRVIERSRKGTEVVTKTSNNASAGANKMAAVQRSPVMRRPTPARAAVNVPQQMDRGIAAGERYRQVVDKIRASGQFGNDEAVIEKAARNLMEAGKDQAFEKDPS